MRESRFRCGARNPVVMSLEYPTDIEIQLFQIACAFSREKLIVGAIWFGFQAHDYMLPPFDPSDGES